MRIQYCSDLHLEQEQNAAYLNENPLLISGDILVLAGDIVPLHDEHLRHSFFSFVSQNYKQVFWIPGNHEFYHRDLYNFSNSYNIKLGSNINLVHNVVVDYENIRFVFSTLWSKISPKNTSFMEKNIVDFKLITKNKKKFTVKDFNQLHTESLHFLEKSLATQNKKTVVVTHHLPSDLCNLPKHMGTIMNEAFCTDLTKLIEKSRANFWIYGHSHFNQKPLVVGKTMLLTNQLGYISLDEHAHFKHNAYFSI